MRGNAIILRPNSIARRIVLMVGCAVWMLGGPVNVLLATEVSEGEPKNLPLPGAFVENVGQWDPAIRFATVHGGEQVVVLQDSFQAGVRMEEDGGGVRGERFVFRLEGRSPRAVSGGLRNETSYHFYLGSDPSRWRRDVGGFESVRFEDAWPGVDVVLRCALGGSVEYDVVVRAGGSLSDVVIDCDGMRSMSVDVDGSLVLVGDSATLVQYAPRAFQVASDGTVRSVSCSFNLLGDGRFGFASADTDPGVALVIDPGLEWSTFLGGTHADHVFAVAMTTNDEPMLAGYTYSVDYPVTPGAFDESYNPEYSFCADGFVTRLSSSGDKILSSTFLGGECGSSIGEILVRQDGAIVLAGAAGAEFPVTPGAFSTTYSGGADLFVATLDPTGSTLLFSTYLGGSNGETFGDIALSDAGNMVMCGATTSTDYPVTVGAYDTIFGGPAFESDAVISCLDPTGSQLLSSTFLGGMTDGDGANGVAVSSTGSIVASGTTGSADFPVTAGAYDITVGGNNDHFVSEFDPTLSTLLNSTFLGGSASETARDFGIDPTGARVVYGDTKSPDYPITPDAFDKQCFFGGGTCSSGYFARLNSSGTALLYSTYLGGGGSVTTKEMVMDPWGGAVFVGVTNSSNYPVTEGALDTVYNNGISGSSDGYVTRIGPDNTVWYSTYLGGTASDLAYGVGLDSTGAATVTGVTDAFDFPTTPGAWDTTSPFSAAQGFVSRLDLLPVGVRKFGKSTAGCGGPLPVTVKSSPKVGNLSFGLYCARAPSSSMGFLGVSGGALGAPQSAAGAMLWLDPGSLLFLPVSSDAFGVSFAPVPLPATLAPGQTGFFQFLFPDPCGPGGVSASHALMVRIQP